MRLFKSLIAATAVASLAGCEVRVKEESGDSAEAGANQQAQDPQAQARARQVAAAKDQGRREVPNLNFIVDISDREVRVFSGDRLIQTHKAAVGTEKWPTPTGSWQFHRVDLNPEWIPPKDEEWAKEEEPKAPGAADNPMGRARLVYRMPNTIHGTNDVNSLGKASSHGSVRVANEVVVQLAQMLLKAGGAWEGDQWFQQMVQNPTREFQITLEQKIPIKVQD